MGEKYFKDNQIIAKNQLDIFCFPSLKQNDDLYDDDKDVIHSVLNIKRVELPHNGEDWEILENGKVVFVLKGVRLTKKEKSILRTADGINLLLKEYKAGNTSVNKIKTKLRNYWKKK